LLDALKAEGAEYLPLEGIEPRQEPGIRIAQGYAVDGDGAQAA